MRWSVVLVHANTNPLHRIICTQPCNDVFAGALQHPTHLESRPCSAAPEPRLHWQRSEFLVTPGLCPLHNDNEEQEHEHRQPKLLLWAEEGRRSGYALPKPPPRAVPCLRRAVACACSGTYRRQQTPSPQGTPSYSSSTCRNSHITCISPMNQHGVQDIAMHGPTGHSQALACLRQSCKPSRNWQAAALCERWST